jgi:UDP-N-acetylglucosamine--N-acetylmuramyl-(pentapeptide) pyrophosphoryl-undecaprenol N-acetylglucosamine transferase
MGDAYAAADLVLCRAGASTLAELWAVGRPAILVPYPFAHADHQTSNARAAVDAGAATLLPDQEMSGPRLVAAVTALIGAPGKLSEMAASSRALGRPDAAGAVLEIVWEMAGQPPASISEKVQQGTKQGAA